MNDQSQTAANTPSEPILCKMGCGFFGNGATNGCCSKCWRDMQKNQAPPSPCKPVEPVVEEAQPMEVEVSAPSPVTETASREDAAAGATPIKKKKKKTSYKNLLADMMHGSTTRDIEKRKSLFGKLQAEVSFRRSIRFKRFDISREDACCMPSSKVIIPVLSAATVP